MIPLADLDNRTDRETQERARIAKERADRARAQIRPMIQTGGKRPTVRAEPPEHLRPPATCATCGGTMAIIEPGQTTHPGCTPAEAEQEQPA